MWLARNLILFNIIHTHLAVFGHLHYHWLKKILKYPSKHKQASFLGIRKCLLLFLLKWKVEINLVSACCSTSKAQTSALTRCHTEEPMQAAGAIRIFFYPWAGFMPLASSQLIKHYVTLEFLWQSWSIFMTWKCQFVRCS